MRCYICDGTLEQVTFDWNTEDPICTECLEVIEETIERDEIEEANDNRPV